MQGPNLCKLCNVSQAHRFKFYSYFQLRDCSTHVTVQPMAMSCELCLNYRYFPRHCPTTLLSHESFL